MILVRIVADILVLVAVALEKSNLANIREMEHKDQFGNIISMLSLVYFILSIYFFDTRLLGALLTSSVTS